MNNSQRGPIAPLIIVLLTIAIIGGIFTFQKKSDRGVVLVSDSKTTFDDSDMKISLQVSSIDNNAISAFNAIDKDSIAKADRDFLDKYFKNYSQKNLPPLAQSEKILSKYPNVLASVKENSEKEFQCFSWAGQKCNLSVVMNSADIAALKALTLYQKGKYVDAKEIAAQIVTLGQNITSNAGDAITFLVGWSIQGLGYNVFYTIKLKDTSVGMSENEKVEAIAMLRSEHKVLFRYQYSLLEEAVDYITSKDNKLSGAISEEEEASFNLYRTAAADPASWNPVETKRYFYDSLKIETKNVEADCNASTTKSVLNLNFNPNDANSENYVGKSFYTVSYVSFDALNQKRCIVENLIKGL